MGKISLVISRLNEACNEIRSDIVKARQESSPTLEEAKSLLMQRQETEKKVQLLRAFNRHFVISDEDSRLLTSSVTDIGDLFFSALEKVKRVYGDCRILLGSENQRLGLDLMEQCSRTLNAAYQKLYRWIQMELKAIDFENPQINSLSRKALRTLSERPSLFQSCLEVFADARDRALSDGFYTALTGSSAPNDRSQGPKPIEFSAHDPIRHVGDMLAWAHAAAVTEKEILESFFTSDRDEITNGLEEARSTDPWSSSDDEPFDGHKVSFELMSRNMNGVLRTLCQECEQVIRIQDDAVLTYNMVNVFSFYRTIFTKLLKDDSTIVNALLALEKIGLQKAEALLSDQFASIETDANIVPQNLAVPEFLQESLTQLGLLMNAYASSMTPGTTRTTDPMHLTHIALDPALQICKSISSDLEEPAKSIFLVNCFDACQSKLASIEPVMDDPPIVDLEMSHNISNLMDHQHAYLLHHSGLHPLLAALALIAEDDEQLGQKISALPQCQPAALQDAAQVLDDFLPSALMDASENLKDIINRRIADEIISEAAEQFCEDFEYVEGKLITVDEGRLRQQQDEDADGDEHDHKANNVEEEPTLLRPFYPRTSGEIRVLLSS